MSQKGFVPVFFILGILITSALIIGGSFYLKSNTKLLNKTNSANDKDVKAQNWLSLDSPCINFKYPKSWLIDSEKIVNEHKINTKGIDTYGTTIVSFRKLDKLAPSVEQAFNLSISCLPNKLLKPTTFEAILKSDKEDFERHASDNTPEDKIELVNISGVAFNRIIKNAYLNKNGGSRTGTIIMNGLNDNYSFLVSLSWPYLLGNDSNHEARRDFEAIIQSISIKK